MDQSQEMAHGAMVEWNPLLKRQLAAFFAGFGVFVLSTQLCEPGFIPVLDHANLLFHEAGHPLVGLFSQRLETYGGTLGQLTFPIILVFSNYRKKI
ncbi:MAG TPA: hypothetical protein EYQ50_08140 [Verrucomicrobiales bacterium]|nr:hypothetical protein [Verrucomicrobiales bacterium]